MNALYHARYVLARLSLCHAKHVPVQHDMYIAMTHLVVAVERVWNSFVQNAPQKAKRAIWRVVLQYAKQTSMAKKKALGIFAIIFCKTPSSIPINTLPSPISIPLFQTNVISLNLTNFTNFNSQKTYTWSLYIKAQVNSDSKFKTLNKTLSTSKVMIIIKAQTKSPKLFSLYNSQFSSFTSLACKDELHVQFFEKFVIVLKFYKNGFQLIYC